MQRSALCRSRRELSNAYLLAKIGVDTAENEPLEVWGKIQNIQYYSIVSLLPTPAGLRVCVQLEDPLASQRIRRSEIPLRSQASLKEAHGIEAVNDGVVSRGHLRRSISLSAFREYLCST